MRSGTFKESYAGLIVLSDSVWVWLWSTLLLAAMIAMPFTVNA